MVGCPRLPTAMQPCFAVRFHRGGKLFISHGGSLWAGKLAVLLRLHHSRHSRQLASCVKDLPCWVEGRCPFPCLRGSFKRRSGFRRQNAFWRRFADVRKRAPSRKKRYPILFRNHPGIPDFVNFPYLFSPAFNDSGLLLLLYTGVVSFFFLPK